MASAAQIDANRRNSLKSTGPRSVEGKAASRFNALKTGITAHSMVIPGEDPTELDTLAADYHRQFQPGTALERFLVDALVSSEWQIRRLHRIEAQLWVTPDQPADASLGQRYASALDTFTRLQRRIDAAERSYYRALKELQRLQTDIAPGCRTPVPDDELASFFPAPEISEELSRPETPRPPETPPGPHIPGS